MRKIRVHALRDALTTVQDGVVKRPTRKALRRAKKDYWISRRNP